MNSLSRRSMLLGLAAAATGAAAVTAMTAEAIASGPDETPALLALGDKLPALTDEMLEAMQALAGIVTEWEARWPMAPDSIVLPYNDSGRWERGFTGGTIMADGCPGPNSPWSEGAARPRSLLSADELVEAIKNIKAAQKRKRRNPFAEFTVYVPSSGYRKATVDECDELIRQITEQHAAAVAYEAKCERNRKASGYSAAVTRRSEAEKALSDAIKGAMAEPARTMAGVLVKAEALRGFGALPRWGAVFIGVEADQWAMQLGDEIIAIATAGARSEGRS